MSNSNDHSCFYHIALRLLQHLYSGLRQKAIARLRLVESTLTTYLPLLPFGIDFKILLLTCKVLHGLGPKYISDLLVPCEPVRDLKSSAVSFLSIHKSNLVTKGGGAFALRIPCLRNSLKKNSLKMYFYIKVFLYYKFSYFSITTVFFINLRHYFPLVEKCNPAFFDYFYCLSCL